jgi:hypothetical protein
LTRGLYHTFADKASQDVTSVGIEVGYLTFYKGVWYNPARGSAFALEIAVMCVCPIRYTGNFNDAGYKLCGNEEQTYRRHFHSILCNLSK